MRPDRAVCTGVDRAARRVLVQFPSVDDAAPGRADVGHRLAEGAAYEDEGVRELHAVGLCVAHHAARTGEAAPLADAFAAALTDPARRESAAKHNQELVAQQALWDANMARMEDAYRGLAGAGVKAGGATR